MKKKLLLSLGITLLSINSFSKMTITSYNNGSSVSNGSITESGHNFSGIVQFLGNQGGTYVVKLDNGTKIETGTRFDLDPDTTITIEGAIDKIGAKKASETALNSVLGIYGVAELNKIDLYGNVEYRQKYGSNSYHSERDVDSTTKIDALNYKKATVNASAGLRYKITDMFDINASYGLNNLKNNIVKVGIGIQY